MTVTAPEAFLGGGAYPPTYEIIRHLTSFLQWRFSCLPPGAYQWRPEGSDEAGQGKSEIFIGGDTPINPVTVGQRPAITLVRAQASFQGIGLNDRAYVDLRTGAHVQMDIIPTTIHINVLSSLPVEADRIAWFITEQIRGYREAIIKEMKALLYIGQRPSLSAPSPAGSLVQSTEHEWTVVVCSFPTYLQHATSMLPLNQTAFYGFGAVTIQNRDEA